MFDAQGKMIVKNMVKRINNKWSVRRCKKQFRLI